jgi:hypothetical protein
MLSAKKEIAGLEIDFLIDFEASALPFGLRQLPTDALPKLSNMKAPV